MKNIIKRTLALLIVAIYVFQAVGYADDANNEFIKGTPGTHVAWAWLLPAKEAQTNVHQMFYVAGHTAGNRPDDPENSLANLSKISALDGAKKMKVFMDKKPAGGRVVMPIMSRLISDPKLDGTNTYDNWFWWDEGVEKGTYISL